jgi:tRNA-modifying protein YgfZ
MNTTKNLSISLLSDTSIIAVSGVDASRFLQGQLSCNLSRLDTKQCLRGALCNLKGRVIADMLLVADEGKILLCSQRGMSPIILSTLEKYRVFFKTDLQDRSDNYVRVGLFGLHTIEKLTSVGLPVPQRDYACARVPGICVTRLPDSALLAGPRFECLVELTVDTKHIMDELLTDSVEPDEKFWRLCDIRSGIAHIRPGQEERYTPQLLNYDVNGVIDFGKGCYTGQEVVARMFYRAEAKKRMFYFQGTETPDVTKIDIIDSVSMNDQQEVLLVMDTEQAMSSKGITAFY